MPQTDTQYLLLVYSSHCVPKFYKKTGPMVDTLRGACDWGWSVCGGGTDETMLSMFQDVSNPSTDLL